MSVQPTTSFVLTQPPQPPPGSLVLTHQPGLVLSQPVAAEPSETIVLGHPHGASVPGSFVLTQPAPQPGTIVFSQPSGTAQFVPPRIVLPATDGVTAEFEAGPVFSQAGRGGGSCVGTKMEGEGRTADVPVYHIPSGSLQPAPGQQDVVSSSCSSDTKKTFSSTLILRQRLY